MLIECEDECVHYSSVKHCQVTFCDCVGSSCVTSLELDEDLP